MPLPCHSLPLQGETSVAMTGMGIPLRAFKTRSHERDIPSPHKTDQSKLSAEHLSASQPEKLLTQKCPGFVF